MKVHNCIQGTHEWLKLRAGIPTASQFDKILTPGGEPSKSAEPYMFALLAERLMGHPIIEHISMWMKRGSQMESDAVAFYEFQHDVKTVPVGFITTDDGTRGASPDRLVGDTGLLEIKTPSEPVHMSYLLKSGGAYKAYKVQVQGQLLIARREWEDVLSFHPELPEAEIRIERDEKYIDRLDKILTAFCEELEAKYQALVKDGTVELAKQKRGEVSDEDFYRGLTFAGQGAA